MNGTAALGIVTIVDVLMAISLYIPFSTGALFILPIGSMATGAYTFGWLALHGTSTLLAFIAGIVSGAVLTLVGGGLAIRLRGWEAAIAGFAMAEIVQVFFFNFGPTGGAAGLAGVPFATTFTEAIVICVIVILGLLTLELSRVGLYIRVIRADELVAECSGIRVRRLRLTLYVLSGAVAGVAGVLSAGFLGIVDPSSYGLSQINQYLVGTVLGGSTTVLGGTAGGVVLGVLPNYIAGLASFSLIVFSVIILIMMVIRPEGLITTGLVLRAARALHLRPYRRWRIRPASSAVAGAPAGAGLEIKGISKAFGGVHVLTDVGIFVEAGEIHGLIGSNGAGKTTLLNIVSGVVKPDSGEIVLNGTRATRWRSNRLVRLGLARTFQNIRLSDDLAVREHVDAAAQTDIGDVMAMLGLDDVEWGRPHSLPYGLQRKVEIARALAAHPRIVLLDEPAAGMAASEIEELSALIARIRASGITVLVIDHNVGFIRRIADRVTVLDFGKVIAEGVPEQIMRDPAVIDAYLGEGAAARLAKGTGQETPTSALRNESSALEHSAVERGQTP